MLRGLLVIKREYRLKDLIDLVVLLNKVRFVTFTLDSGAIVL